MPRFAIGLALLCGCGSDPKLVVKVEHEAGLPIEKTIVSVYESASLTCEDVAFMRVGPDELSAVFVSQQEVNSDGETIGGELTGLSRTDHKVIVVRGYDANNAWRAAGCAEKEAIDDRIVVTIKTMSTVTASLVPIESDAQDPFVIAIAATDGEYKGVSGRRVSWTVYAPAGSKPITSTAKETQEGIGIWEPIQPSCTTSNGFVRVRPVPPDVVGGYAVQVRVQWALQLPALYSSFTAAPTIPQLLSPVPATISRVCAARIYGSLRRLACIDDTNKVKSFSVGISNGRATLNEMVMEEKLLDPEAIALLSIPNGANRDVYQLTLRGVLRELWEAPAPGNMTPICPAGTCDTPVQDAIYMPSCGSSLPAKLLLLVNESGRAGATPLVTMNIGGGGFANMDAAAKLVTMNPADRPVLDNAGCVDRFDPSAGTTMSRQVFTFHKVDPSTGDSSLSGAAYNCIGGNCAVNEMLPSAGVSFTSGDEARMIITGIDATGVVLRHVVLAPETPNKDRFIERLRYPSASIPDHMIAGRFDDDENPDLFWNIAGRSRATTFEVAYARDVGPAPLEALSPSQTLSISTLDGADLNGDTYDDIIATGQSGTNVRGASVVPVHVTSPVQTLKPDETCGP